MTGERCKGMNTDEEGDDGEEAWYPKFGNAEVFLCTGGLILAVLSLSWEHPWWFVA